LSFFELHHQSASPHAIKSGPVAVALLSWWLLKGVGRDNGLSPKHTAAGIPESGVSKWR